MMFMSDETAGVHGYLRHFEVVARARENEVRLNLAEVGLYEFNVPFLLMAELHAMQAPTTAHVRGICAGLSRRMGQTVSAWSVRVEPGRPDDVRLGLNMFHPCDGSSTP
jgi:hypothetical protein